MMRRHLAYSVLLWIVLTGLGEYYAFNANLHPFSAAREADIIDEAFRFLLILGMPVFTFVLAGLAYSVLRFRVPEGDSADGPNIRSSRWVTLPWLVITTGLAIFVVFNPGLKGLRELEADPDPDLIVRVSARKWQWAFEYADLAISLDPAEELVLPVDRRVKFEITSEDIIHSFWIPAFRLKADAVPGLTTDFLVTPTVIGEFSDDFNLRVQCAELCGTGHPRMRTRVRVLSQADFDQWTVQNQGGSSP